MRSSSSFLAPSAIAISSMSLLCGLSGTAVSQTTGSAAPIPSVTVQAPSQVARPPHKPVQSANTGAGRRAAPAARTSAQTGTLTPSSVARGPVMAKLARLEKEASSCNDGCETSFRRGKDPWIGCSESAGYLSVFSATCTDTLTHKSYVDCMETKVFLGWERNRAWWYCNSLMVGGKFRVTAANRNR